MRLIRLTSREPTAVFDATFNENLVFPPNSKIAVQSVAAGVERKELILDGTNNSLNYQIGTATFRNDLNVEAGEYKANNIEELLRYIQKALNLSCNFPKTPTPDGTNKMLGIEWNADKNDDKKVEIQYGIGRYGPHTTNWEFTGTQFTGTVQSPVFKSLSAAAVSDSSVNCIFPYLLAKGNSFIRSRVNLLTAGATVDPEEIGYIMGITKNLEATGANLSVADYYLAIHITIIGGNRTYRLFVDGVEDVGAQTAAPVGDFIEVGINGGNFVANRYAAGSQVAVPIGNAVPIPDGTLTGSLDNSVRPFFVFRGGNLNAAVENIRLTPSPFGPQPPDFQQPIDQLGDPPVPISSTRGPNFFFFHSLELANFLGFPNQRIPVTGFNDLRVASYVASSEFPIPQEADAFLVLLDSLQLQSYDSFSKTQEPSGGQRRNILTVIPSSNETGSLVYEPSYPTFIDLDNANPLLVRNIRARIVRNDYSAVEVQGLSSLVLLVDN
jgi:hypothetical protein